MRPSLINLRHYFLYQRAGTQTDAGVGRVTGDSMADVTDHMPWHPPTRRQSFRG